MEPVRPPFVVARGLTAVLCVAALLLGGCGGGDERTEIGALDGFHDLDGTPLDPTLDGDQDGLLDSIEITPREILIDSSGFGVGGVVKELERRQVTSSITSADTDGDGLTDYEEYLIRSDPSASDTDGDGLSDYAEWTKWFSSPVSVDSDGDSTGRNHDEPPNGFLFDGQELLGTWKGSTSPTLDDTDGDGRMDGEEIDHAFRSPLIAELPKVDLEIVSAPRIQLFVTYAEEAAQSESFSSSLTTASSEAVGSTSSRTHASHLDFSFKLTAGIEHSWGAKGGTTVKAEASQGVDWGSSDSKTEAYTRNSTVSTQRTAARYWQNANSFSETAASGEIFLDMRIRNAGDTITFRLTQLGVAVRMWSRPSDPEQPPTFQTLAVLTPTGFDSFTLPPGGSTPPIPVSATGLNPALVKEFLSNPASLTFEPIYFDLENAEGINFNFLTENAFAQTAMLEIDRGSGQSEIVRVATNVRRSDPDESGQGGGRYTGIPLKKALEDILHRKVQTTKRRVTFEGVTREVSVLSALEDMVASEQNPPATFTGTVDVTAGNRVATVRTGPPPAAGGGGFEAGWEDAWLGRTLLVQDPPVAGFPGRDVTAYVVVAVKDAAAMGMILLDRPYEGVAGVGADYMLNELFQVEPHVRADDPTVPAPVEAGPRLAFWVVLGTDGTQLTPLTDFEDVVLHAGDQVRLSFWVDGDGDGLSSRSEEYYNCPDEPTDEFPNSADCDGDGLGDSVETIRGWLAGAPSVLPIERAAFLQVVEDLRANPDLPAAGTTPEEIAAAEEFARLKAKIILSDPLRGYPRWVHSTAGNPDGDGDGLTDFFECVKGTDPTRPDTDGDGLDDKADPFPLHPARVLYVNANWAPPVDVDDNPIPVPGLTDPDRGLAWETAFTALQDALAAARARNADFLRDDAGNFLDEVGAIIRTPGGTPIDETETDPTLLALRSPDPANDIAAIWLAEGVYRPDQYAVGGPFEAELGGAAPDGRDYTFQMIDAVAIRGGFLGTERKLFERQEGASDLVPTVLSGDVAGGRCRHVVTCGVEGDPEQRATSRATLLDSLVVSDSGWDRSGGAFVNYGGRPTITAVRFERNDVSGNDESGGAVFDTADAGGPEDCAAGDPPGGLYLDCVFSTNRAQMGGAVRLLDVAAVFRGCRFENNQVDLPAGALPAAGDANLTTAHEGDGGAVLIEVDLCEHTVRFEDCAFENNVANRGAAIAHLGGNVLTADCTFRGNSTRPASHGDFQFPHNSWVVGLTATPVAEMDDVLFIDSDPDTEYYEQRLIPSGYPGAGSPLMAGDAIHRDLLKIQMTDVDDGPTQKDMPITFVDGQVVTEIGAANEVGKPTWEAPKSYLSLFEEERMPGGNGALKTHRTGGAIFCGGGHLMAAQSVFYRNQAAAGGAIAFFGTARVDVVNCTFARNQGIGLGAAVYAPDSRSAGFMVNTITGGQADAVVTPPSPPALNVTPTDDLSIPGGDPARIYNLFYYFDKGGELYGGGDLFEAPFNVDLYFPAGSHTLTERFPDGWTAIGNFAYRPAIAPTQVYVQSGAYGFENCLMVSLPTLGGDEAPGDFDGFLGNILGGAAPGGEGYVAFVNVSNVNGLDLMSNSNAVDNGKETGTDYDPFTPGFQPAPATDIAGRPRRAGRIDIGAYEYQPDP